MIHPVDMGPMVSDGPCICLTEQDLERFGLDDSCVKGDEIHLIGRVMSVTKTDRDGVKSCRVDVCLEKLADEHETEEEEAAEAAE